MPNEEMPLVFEKCGEKSCLHWKECCAKEQQVADLAIFEKWKADRLEYEIKFTDEIVLHTRKDFAFEEAEWLEGRLLRLLDNNLPYAKKELKAHIASLKGDREGN